MVKNIKNNSCCIGCGICEAVCPQEAITIQLNEYKEYIPVVNKEKCTNCSICKEYCPSFKEKLKQEAICLNNLESSGCYGIENNSYYLAWNNNDEERLKSASGGVITALAKHLLQAGAVNKIIHAEAIEAKRGEMHFKASISTAIEEIDQKRSSIYAPICFNKILKSLTKPS